MSLTGATRETSPRWLASSNQGFGVRYSAGEALGRVADNVDPTATREVTVRLEHDAAAFRSAAVKAIERTSKKGDLVAVKALLAKVSETTVIVRKASENLGLIAE